MKQLQLFALIACVTPFLVSCETTDMVQQPAPAGSQQAKHIAAVKKEDQENASVDESERNLWNSQRDVLVRDGESDHALLLNSCAGEARVLLKDADDVFA